MILALDCDFLGLDDVGVAYKKAFARTRTPEHAMSRLYVAEPALTVTGAAADRRAARARKRDV